MNARPTKPARPAAKRKASKRAASAPQPPPTHWIEWHNGIAAVNLHRLSVGREVLAGVKTAQCPGCSSVGIKVDERWYHSVEVATERPTGECELFASLCPECGGSGRIHR